jgi:Rho termination factor, N-terminal domain
MGDLQVTRRTDSFRMNPITLGCLVGAIVAFFVVGALSNALWVLLGAAIGGAIGYGVHLLAHRANTYATAVELDETATLQQLRAEAKRLEIEGRTKMTKAELVTEIADRRTP